METTIKTRIITTEETAETPNANYELCVTRKNGEVTKVAATVCVQKAAVDGEGITTVSAETLGTVTYSAGALSVINIPADAALPTYIAEILEIIESIKAREE